MSDQQPSAPVPEPDPPPEPPEFVELDSEFEDKSLDPPDERR